MTIYRPLEMVGDHRTGVPNTATEICAPIRFTAEVGLAPDIDLPLDFVSADICAAAIRCIPAQVEATAAPTIWPAHGTRGWPAPRGSRATR